MATQQAKRDVYEIITKRIIDCLERGIVPWKQSWTEAGIPMNIVTKKPYRGINLWLLSSLGYEQNLFLTLRQLKEIGGNLKKEKTPGYEVIFWNWLEETSLKEGKEQETKKKPLLRYYRVYNIEQCTGIPDSLVPDPVPPNKNKPILICENIVNGMPLKPVFIIRSRRRIIIPCKIM